MPGTVRSASSKVVTFFSLSTSCGITVTERGVSMSGAVNLYESSVFTCIPDGADMTFTAGNVASAAALVPVPAFAGALVPASAAVTADAPGVAGAVWAAWA